MKKLIIGALCMALISITGPVLAQDSGYHPVISDSFVLSVGAMRSSNSFKVRAEGLISDPIFDDDIDFNDSLGVDDKSTFLNAQFVWKFGNEKKWRLAGQYFSNNATGDITLEEDVEWQDVIFREGSFVGAGTGLDVTRLSIGRSFFKNDQNDFGIGIGIHNLKLSAYIEGQIGIDDEVSEFYRGDVSESQILPNIGAWYLFSPASRWLFHARVDWISASVGDYDGTLWNTSLGVNFQAWDHVGFDLYWQYFNLDINVDSTDWVGGMDMRYSGPVLGMTVNW